MSFGTRTGPVTKDTSTVALGLAQIRVGKASSYVSNAEVALGPADSMGAMAETKLTSDVEYWKLTSGFPALEDLSIPLSETCSFECTFKEITPKNMALARGIDPFIVGDGVTPYGAHILNSAAGTLTTVAATKIIASATCPVDTFTVTFSSATSYSVEGFNSGPLTGTGNAAQESKFSLPNNADCLTIPATFFTGTWANKERARFATQRDGYSDNHAGEVQLGGLKAPEYVRMEAVYTYPDGTHHMYIIFPRANVTSNIEIAFSDTDNAQPTITFEAKRADSEVDGGNAVWDMKPLGRIYWD